MKVSVIIPIYNVAQYLIHCLQSVTTLGERICEIICINDGSTDNSRAIIIQFAKKDSRIQLIDQKNSGISSARNTGIEAASGDFLLFVDGDDYIFPQKLEALLDEIESLDNINGVWTGYIREDWNGNHIENTKLTTGVWNQKQICDYYIPAILGISYDKLNAWFRGEQPLNGGQEFPTIWRGLYSKKIIDKYGIRFDVRVKTGEDILFNWKFYSYAENLLVSNNNYYCYVWRKGSLTQDTNQKFYEAKSLFLKIRDMQNADLKSASKRDYADEYQATLVLTKIQMALILSKCPFTDLLCNYKKFKHYSSQESILIAYKNLELKEAPMKFKIVFGIAKLRWDLALFLGCSLLNKLNIHIYPDE